MFFHFFLVLLLLYRIRAREVPIGTGLSSIDSCKSISFQVNISLLSLSKVELKIRWFRGICNPHMALYVVLNELLPKFDFGHSLRPVIIEKCMIKEKHKLKNTKSHLIIVLCSHLKVAFLYIQIPEKYTSLLSSHPSAPIPLTQIFHEI